MATQQAGASPKTKRFGIFPHPVRKFIILFALILFIIAGIIGVQQAWGNLSNILAVIFGVVGVILGILTFWPSTRSNGALAPVSPVPPQPPPVQVNIYNNPGQPADPQHIPSSMTNNANNNELGGQATIPNTGATNVHQPLLKNAPTVNPPVSPAPVLSAQRDELLQGERPASPLPGAPPAFALPSASSIPSGGFPERANKTPAMKLTGQECNDLTDALLDAYPEQEDFEVMLKVKLNKKLNTLVDGSHNYWNLIFKLIEVTEAQGWTSDLVIAAHERRPLNSALQSWQLKYTAAKEISEVTNTPTANNIGPELRQTTQASPGIAEPPQDGQAMTANQERQKQQKTNVSPDPGVQKGQESSQVSLDEQPLAKARRSIREAHDSVQQSKVIFEGRGDIQQIHYSQAAAALRLAASCTQNLQNLLQTTSPFPAYLDRERLIMDLRHINTEVKESIEHIASYGTLNAHQRERDRKDTGIRLSTILTYLDDVGRRLMSKDPL